MIFSLLLACALDDAGLSALAEHAQSKVDSGKIAGAVVVVGDQTGAKWTRAFGRIEKGGRPMPVDAIFDLASVTKVVAGSSALAVALEDGKLALDDNAARFVPEIKAHAEIVIDHLLRHRSGLPPIVDVRRQPAARPDLVLAAINRAKPRAPPGVEELYSDVGVIILGRAVERAYGQTLDGLLTSSVFSPLGMRDTGWLIRPADVSRRASSSPRRAPWGAQAHDPLARAYQSKSAYPAHAGLFSTAPDLARFCAALLSGGAGVFDEGEVDLMLRPHGGANAYGFEAWAAPDGTVGVGKIGWTGAFLFISKQRDVFMVYLTNRTAMNDDDDVMAPDFDGAIRSLWQALPKKLSMP